MMLTGGIVANEVLTNSIMSCRKRPMSPHVKEYCHSRKSFHSGFSDGAQLSNGLSKHESSTDVGHLPSTSAENLSYVEPSNNEINALQEKRDYLKLLQKQLGCEEAKLILLKKLRSSQLLLYTQQTTNVRTVDAKPTNDINAKQHSYSHPMTKNKPVPQQQQHRQNQVQRPSPSNLQVQNKMHQQTHAAPFGVPPNAQPSRSQHAQHYRSNAHMQRPPPVETAEQRYATAKLHMRRNLEKMLLSVPLPKPPQVDFTFIPSLASMEFQTLLGLEETVRFLKDGLYKRAGNAEKLSVPPAYFCAQCKTSCSPLWRRLPESSDVICEKCAKHNQKKIAKTEHTNKLQNAFSKVAQQEKEFEQKFQSESMNFTMNNVANIQNVSNPSPSSSLASQPAYFPLTSDHLKFYQTQILRSSTFPSLLPGVTLPFMTSSIAAALSGKGNETNAQYLLDMIPSANNKQGSTRSSDSYKKC